jgi:type II secretory ATPase GspE/PulE/Tfp pilus assembly ATPase PilB-like protein
LPVERVGSTLVVAFPAKPADDQLAAVRFAAGLPVVAFQASSPALLQSLVARHYADTSATFVKNALLDKGRYAKATADVQTPAGFFRYLVALAIGNGASDIHLRPYPDGSCKVLLRVDGLFRPVRDVTAKDVQALVRHIEALSGLDFFNRVSAKEGRLSIEYETRQVDLRVSVIGGASGDSVVLRVLDPLRFPASLEQLALPKPQLRALGGVLMRPHGMLVATGPTGSGKTTTLYTLLKELHARGLHVVTAEDPVEYRLAGINQFEGSDFSALLPKLLRHDPDVLMVGELRDEATVRMALNAALTGHLVLSTVHANDSASTVHRLLGLGAPMHILASCLTGILSQRLVRLLCVSCAGAGCQACGGTGFLGRTLAAELAKPRRSLAGFEGTPSYVDMVSHLDYLGGVTLDGSIVDLAKSGRTSWVEAASLISDPALLPHAMRIDLGYDDPVSEGGPPVP